MFKDLKQKHIHKNNRIVRYLLATAAAIFVVFMAVGPALVSAQVNTRGEEPIPASAASVSISAIAEYFNGPEAAIVFRAEYFPGTSGREPVRYEFDCGLGRQDKAAMDGHNLETLCLYFQEHREYLVTAKAYDSAGLIPGAVASFAYTSNGSVDLNKQPQVLAASTTGSSTMGKIGEGLIGFISALVLVIAQFLKEVVDYLFTLLILPIIEAILSIRVHTDVFASAIYPGWVVIRNITNIIFIVALIAMGMGTLFRVESYQFRGLIIQLVIAALLVNFSLVIGQAVLGLADTIQFQFLPDGTGAIKQTAGDIMKRTLNISFTEAFERAQFGDAIAAILSVVIAVMTLIVFLILAGFLLVRIVALWVLLMVSPIAYVAGILPITKQYRKKWWDEFLKYAFITPILAFFLNFIAILSRLQSEGLIEQNIRQASINQTQTSNFYSFISAVLGNGIILIFLLFGIKAASSSGIAGASAIVNYSQKAVTYPFRRAGKYAKDKGAAVKQSVDTQRLKLANKLGPAEGDEKKGIKSFFKRGAFGVLSGGAVSQAKADARKAALEGEQKKAGAMAEGHLQVKKGEKPTAITKFEQQKLAEALKKSSDIYANADVNDLTKGLKEALANKDHITVQALLQKASNDNVMTDVLKDPEFDGKINNVYDMARSNGMKAEDLNRIGNTITRLEASKGRYQNYVQTNIEDEGYRFGNLTDNQKTSVTANRNDKIKSLTLEDMAKVNQELYVDPVTNNLTEVFRNLEVAFADPDMAKNLVTKMRAGDKSKFKDLVMRRSTNTQAQRNVTSLIP